MGTCHAIAAVLLVSAGLAGAQTASGPASQPGHPPLEGYTGPTGRIRGMVAFNGKPAAGHAISIWRDSADGAHWSGDLPIAITGADGRFDLGKVPPGEMLLLVHQGTDARAGTGSLLGDRVVLATDEVHDVALEFDVGGVTGRIVGRDGAALPKGLVVKLAPDSHDEKKALSKGSSVSVASIATVDASGGFRIDEAQAGDASLTVECEDVVVSLAEIPVAVARGAVADAGRITVFPLVTVTGRVEFASGVAIPEGKRVTVGFARDTGSGLVYEWADVDTSDGSFRIRVVPGHFETHGTVSGVHYEEYQGDPVDVSASGAKDIVVKLRPTSR